MDKKYYIFVGDEKIEVDQEVYKSYWQITNRERYLERLDRQNKLLFFLTSARNILLRILLQMRITTWKKSLKPRCLSTELEKRLTH